MGKETTAVATIGNKTELEVLLAKPELTKGLDDIACQYLSTDNIKVSAKLAVSRQPKLLQCTKKSFIEAIVKAKELGLDFTGLTGQGYLIPYGNTCQFIPGYQGLIELAYRSGQVAFIDTQLVYEKDKCEYQLGSKPSVTHIPYMGADGRGKILFGYAIVILKDSPDTPKVEIMSHSDIMKIKARSKAKNSGPWVTDEPEMMRKTVLRRAYKYIPKTQILNQAIVADNDLYDINGSQREQGSLSGVDTLKDRLADNKAKPVVSKEVTKPKTKTATKPQEAAQDVKTESEGQSTPEEEKEPVVTPPPPADLPTKYWCNSCKQGFDKLNNNDLCPNCFSSRWQLNELVNKEKDKK